MQINAITQIRSNINTNFLPTNLIYNFVGKNSFDYSIKYHTDVIEAQDVWIKSTFFDYIETEEITFLFDTIIATNMEILISDDNFNFEHVTYVNVNGLKTVTIKLDKIKFKHIKFNFVGATNIKINNIIILTDESIKVDNMDVDFFTYQYLNDKISNIFQETDLGELMTSVLENMFEVE